MINDKITINTAGLGRKILYGFLGLVLLWAANRMVFSVNNHQVAALTYINGHVGYFFSPGIYCQCLGSVEFFENRTKYDFEEHIQFNDGAHATIKGSVQILIPRDQESFSRMYKQYPSPGQIQSGLIETNLQKAVYLTGRTMSSKESYAERRGDLLAYMEDQLKHGPYQTKSYTKEIEDELDHTKKRLINVVEILSDPKEPGGLARAEAGLVKQFNVETSNFNFSVTYDGEVEKQIQSMQQKAQQINDKIAEAKMAEQNAITIVKNGEADAAGAKWAQEKINAQRIAESKMKVEVAEQEKLEAEFHKKKLILEGEGEAEKKRLILNADGALQQKLATLVEIAKINGDAIKGYQGNWVPTVVTGGGGAGMNGSAMMEALTVKALKDLSLDISVPNGARKGK